MWRPGLAGRLLVAGVSDVVDEAVALQVHPRQPVRALRVAPCDAYEVVVDAKRLRVLRDPVRHDRWQRSQHELAQHHVMDDPLPVKQVAPRQAVGELGGPQRFERPVVDLEPGQRDSDGFEQLRLHVGEAGLGCDRRRDAPCDEQHFVGVVIARVCVRLNHSMSLPPSPASYRLPAGSTGSAGCRGILSR